MDLSHPHDSFVRSWLSQPDQLAQFLKLCLPKETLAAIELDSLAIGDGTFIDEDHREHFSDVQATVAIKGGEASIYILVEHKSYNDPWALLQILRYMVNTWTRDSRNNRGEPLKLIIPILFYHGDSPGIRTSFGELFGPGVLPELAMYLPQFLCSVFNLTSLPDNMIENSHSPELEAALWALKYSRTQLDLVFEALERLSHSVDEAFFQSPALQSIQLYLLSSSEATPEEVLDRMSAIVTNFNLRGSSMNTAQQLVARGRVEGRVEGVVEGRLEAKREDARQLSALGVSIEIICKATGLTRDEVEVIVKSSDGPTQ